MLYATYLSACSGLGHRLTPRIVKGRCRSCDNLKNVWHVRAGAFPGQFKGNRNYDGYFTTGGRGQIRSRRGSLMRGYRSGYQTANSACEFRFKISHDSASVPFISGCDG